MSLTIKAVNTYEEAVSCYFESVLDMLAPDLVSDIADAKRAYPRMSEYDAVVQACIAAAVFFGGDDIESLRARFDEAVFERAQHRVGVLPFVFDAAERNKCN